MADNISRNISQITAELKKLRAESRESAAEVKKLDGAIKLDSGNITAVKSRFSELAKQLDINNRQAAALKQKQAELNNALSSGNISSGKYAAEMQKINKQLDTVEKSSAELTAELKKQNAAVAAAKFDRLSNGLEKFKASAEKASRAAKAVLVAIAAVSTAFIKLGDELSDTATKMRVSVEALQVGRGLYENFAEGAAGYDEALKALSSTMSSIAKGRGAAYIETLKAIGLASDDLVGKDTATQLEMVSAALRAVPDEAKRVEYAMILMGDAGRNVATVSALAVEDVNAYKQALLDAGLVTTEQAAVADALANKLALVKQLFTAQAAELVTALLPALNGFIELVKIITPILSTVGAGLEAIGPKGTVVLVVALGLVAVLPKLIAVGQALIAFLKLLKTATLAQAAATGALSAAAGPILLVFTAIAAVVLLLIGLFRKLKKSQDDAKDSLAAYSSDLKAVQANNAALAEGYSDTAAQASAAAVTNNSATTNNTTVGDVTINITEPGASATEIEEAVSKSLAIQLAAAR